MTTSIDIPTADEIESLDIPAVLACLGAPLGEVDLQTPEGRDFLRSMCEENPVFAAARPEALMAAAAIQMVAATLGVMRCRAARQLTELLASYPLPAGTAITEYEQYITDPVDRRRFQYLIHATSMASPLRLGPPDEAISQLLDHVGI